VIQISIPRATSATDDPPAPEETAQEKEEDKEMAAYNDYLAQLAERDKASGR